MAKVTMTTFMTLDGVMQAPGAPEEDRSGGFAHGGWLVPYADADMGQFVTQIFSNADAFLLGRRTYEIFSAHWPRVTDRDDPVAGPLNTLPKYVASKTLNAATWFHSRIVRDAAGELDGLKRQHAREIQIHGSGGLAQTLIGKGLVDEYHLLVFPVVLGTGKRLFASGAVPSSFTLVSTRTTGTGVVISTYRPAGRPQYGSVALEP